MASLFQTERCPAGPGRERYGWVLAVGVLMFSATGEAKGLPGNGVQPLLYCQKMTYVVTSHCMHHLPEIWDDVFVITSQATSVGGKPPTDMFWPITANP